MNTQLRQITQQEVRRLEPNERGATFVEYALVLAFLGFVVLGIALVLVPRSEDFATEETVGLLNSYPAGYINSSEIEESN